MLLVSIAGTVGLACAAETLLDDIGQLAPSAAPALLPPITAEGRVGWSCTAEQRARAVDLAGADLPAAP
jgi:hypothetical protein